MHEYPALPTVKWLNETVPPETMAAWRRQREREREWGEILTLLGAPHCPLHVPPILDVPLAEWIDQAFYVAVVGSRQYERPGEVALGILTLNVALFDLRYRLVIVSGGAKGVDSLAIKSCKKLGIPFIEFLPDWDTYGKRAGFLRNEQIIDHSHATLAYYDGTSRGTAHSIRLTSEKQKPLLVLDNDTINCEPDIRAWVTTFDLECKPVTPENQTRNMTLLPVSLKGKDSGDINSYLFG